MKLKTILRSFFMAAIMAVAVSASAEKLPDAVLLKPDGKEILASKLTNKGKPMIISLWATWCRPCRQELDAIAPKLEQWQKQTGVKMVIINTEGIDSKDAVMKMINEKGWTGYELLFAKDNSLAQKLGVRGIPFMIYLDGKGNVVDTTTGFAPGSENHIIEKLLERTGKKAQK